MKYSIKDLEIISGIKAHTIRAWEQRYNIFNPQRDDNNIRLYSAAELKVLLNISFLNKKGLKISHLSKLTSQQLADKVIKECSVGEASDVAMHHWLLATLEMNEELFEKVLSESISDRGLERTMLEGLFPFMQKLGTLWHAGFVAASQEHFISNLIRRKLLSAIDSIPLTSPSEGKVFLLFLPEGEWHELVLLFSYYLIKTKGHQVIYLGQSVPWEDIQKLSTHKQPDFIITVFTFPQMDFDIDSYLLRLSCSFNSSKILLAGQYLEQKVVPSLPNLSVLNGPDDLVSFL